MNIKNEVVHDLVREAAARTGTSQTSVVEVALRRYLAELTDEGSRPRRDERLADFYAELDASGIAGRIPADTISPTTRRLGFPHDRRFVRAARSAAARERRRTYQGSLANSSDARVSAANYLEAAIATDRSGDPVDRTRLDTLLRLNDVSIAAVTEAQVRVARQAYRDFGKCSGHPAQLNLGDCFAYALAIETDEPLLYKGRRLRPYRRAFGAAPRTVGWKACLEP